MGKRKNRNLGFPWSCDFNNETGKAVLKNTANYVHYFNFLKEIWLVRYWIDKLPKEIDERMLFTTLFTNGYAVFFKDEVLGYVCLPCAPIGNFNVYGYPTRVNAYSYSNSGYNNSDLYPGVNCALIYANQLRTVPFASIDMFAYRMADIERASWVNMQAQKTPVLIRCDEKERLSLLNAYKQYSGNEPFMFAYKNFDMNSLQVFKTDAPYLAKDFRDEKNGIWSDAMLYLGINNSPVDKKERENTAESNSNLEQVRVSRNIGLRAIQAGLDTANEIFGLNMEVRYNEELEKLDEYLSAPSLMLDGSGTSALNPDKEGDSDE